MASRSFASRILSITGYSINFCCITHCVHEYLGEFVMCNGPSMEPTLFSSDILLAERISRRFNKVERGDIIIAKSPTNPKQNVCKRIMGMPGDKIYMAENGKIITNDYSTNPYIIVPRGHIWLEGDNAENSTDSRLYGPIPQSLIVSRAVCKLWPQIKLLPNSN